MSQGLYRNLIQVTQGLVLEAAEIVHKTAAIADFQRQIGYLCDLKEIAIEMHGLTIRLNCAAHDLDPFVHEAEERTRKVHPVHNQKRERLPKRPFPVSPRIPATKSKTSSDYVLTADLVRGTIKVERKGKELANAEITANQISKRPETVRL